VTNNSMKSRSSYAVKCEKLNIRARQVGSSCKPKGSLVCSLL
jgi:hypothetical protein